jgi:hypothetical protein
MTMTRSTRLTAAALAATATILALGASMPAYAGELLAQGTDPYYGFVHWVSMGELDRAARQFASDARVIAGPGCTVIAPCVGRDAIARHYLPRLRGGALPMPVTDQRFDGQALTTRGDTLEFRSTGEAPQRLRMWHRIEMGPSCITSLRLEFDASDPATVQWLASRWPPGLASLP